MGKSNGIINSTSLQIIYDADILVIGAGSAGAVAAITAARSADYRVCIIERYGFAGGTSTQMLDTFYGFFNPGNNPRKIVGGVPDEIVNSLDKTNDIFLRPNTYGAGTGVNYNPERLKLVWDNTLAAAGVKVFLHTTLLNVDEQQTYTDCVVWHKAGFYIIRAKRVIDCSGDADFCHLAELEYETAGDLEPAQSLTTTFRMCNVDLQKFEAAGGKKMLQQKMREAIASAKHPLPRAEGSAHEMCQPGCVSTVAVKITDTNPLHMDGLTTAECEGRRQAFIYEDFFRAEVAGYESSKIIGLSNQVGVRETRRVYGVYRLTKEDCMRATIPADSIFLCGAPIEDHRKGADGEQETSWQYIPGDGIYGVPYGTIVPRGSDRSWMAGRCFSATHDAHASCRSMAQTMSMGQAAGMAAVLSIRYDCSAAAVDTNKLRAELYKLGAVLETPAFTADTSRKGWANNIKR